MACLDSLPGASEMLSHPTCTAGTNAIMGASDTIFILDREKRTDNQTLLSMTGRDIEV